MGGLCWAFTTDKAVLLKRCRFKLMLVSFVTLFRVCLCFCCLINSKSVQVKISAIERCHRLIFLNSGGASPKSE